MCQLKSGLVLKNRVFVPDYDSHEEMLKELGIEDNAINAMKTFVRFELSPKDNNVFSDIDDWKINIDQDILPDWWDEEEYKPKVIEAVKDWATNYIHDGVKDLKLINGKHYVRNSEVEACGDSILKAYGTSSVVAFDSSTVEVHGLSTVAAYCKSTVVACGISTVMAYNSSTVMAYNSSTVLAYDNSTIEAHNSSTIIAYNDSTVVAYDCSIVRAYDDSKVKAHNYSIILGRVYCHNVALFDNATHKDNYNKKIYQSGNWGIANV